MKKIYDNEIPKYKKKKSKTNKKSSHKHKYEQCLLYIEEIDDYMLADYCIHCNKIYNIYVIYEGEEGTRVMKGMTKEEKLKKYKHLNIKHAKKLSDKYLK